MCGCERVAANWQGWHVCRRSSGEVRWSGHVCGPCPVGRTGRPWPLIWWSWTELHCILFLSKAVPCKLHCTLWTMLHPTELHCILLSCDAHCWALSHPTELHYTLLSYAAPWWATSPPPPCAWMIILSFATTFYSTLFCTFWSMQHPTELCYILLSYATSCELRCNLTELYLQQYLCPI